MPAWDEQPTAFESSGVRLFGMRYEPSTSVRGAWVIGAPFAEEAKCSYRILVDLARALAGEGFRVLRFDYRGCGDSDGAFGEFTASDWVNDFLAAREQIALHAPEVGFMGLRLGASLAAEAAEQAGDALILWEPLVDGKQYMRLNLQRKKLRQAMTAAEGDDPQAAVAKPEEPDDGSIDFDGWRITPALQESLEELQLLKTPRTFGGRVLIVQIAPHDRLHRNLTALQEAYAAAGADCRVETCVEQPLWNLLDLKRADDLVNQTVAWAGGEAG